MAGKKKQSGVKTSIDPNETAKESQAKLLHGHQEWRMIRLRERIEAARKAQVEEHKDMLQREQEAERREWEAMAPKERERCKRQHERRVRGYDDALNQADEVFCNLPDNYLSARANANAETARQTKYVLLNEIDALWRDVAAEHERAVLDGDADWFERQANAIRSGETRRDTLNQFEAAVAHELEMFCSRARAEQQKESSGDAAARRKRERHMLQTAVVVSVESNPASQESKQKSAVRQHQRNVKLKTPEMEDATLEPAGKHTGVTAQQVLDCFSSRTHAGRFYVRVPIDKGNFKEHIFENSKRAREKIRRIARLLGYVMAD